MSKITNKRLRFALQELERRLLKRYRISSKRRKKKEKRNDREYEREYATRLRKAMHQFLPLIHQATADIRRLHTRGKVPSLNAQQKTTLLLTKHIMRQSNRPMANMLCLFSLLTGIAVSYKTVERLYSDDETEMGLHNLHVLILRKKNVKSIDSCGDASGYALTVRKHYASEVQKRKEKAKKHDNRKSKRAFVYTFMLMDLKTKMYVAYGTSFKSEKEAFEAAYRMLQKLDITIESVRLDKYYSSPCYVDKFSKSKVYIIPRSNATIRGSPKWKETLRPFIEETIAFLRSYYKRNNSEAGFSADKKRFGWKVGQKRADRIDMAMFSTTIWHNLLLL